MEVVSSVMEALQALPLGPRLTPSPAILPLPLLAPVTHTCGVTTSGAAYCWGYNGYGQLGTGDKTNRVTPAPVADNLSVVYLDAGNSHTCGVTTSKVVYCWGQNGSGQLGDGSKTIRYEPLAVSP